MARSPRYGTHTGLINLDIIVNDVNKVVNEKMIGVASDILSSLRSPPPVGTPIDTGWASSNWHPSVDSPKEDTVGSKQNVIWANPGVEEMFAFDIKVNSRIFIQNNVPYMARLNRGWSKQQAEPGFVERIIDYVLVAHGLMG